MKTLNQGARALICVDQAWAALVCSLKAHTETYATGIGQNSGTQRTRAPGR